MLLSEAASGYLDYLLYRRNRSLSTIVTYRPLLREFVHMCGDCDTKSLDFMTVETYATRLAMSGIKPVTVKNKLSAIRSFLRWMGLYDYCSLAPDRIELPTFEPTEANFLTKEEQARFLSAIPGENIRDRAMMELFLSSGLRVTELVNLKWGDIYKRSIAVKRGKGKKDRVAFINQDAEKSINRYISRVRGDFEGILFPNPDGGKLSRQVIEKKVHRYAKLADIHKNVSCHTLRHSFATIYLMNGGRIEDLQKILGHKNIQTTLIYLHWLDPYLHQSYDKIMDVPREEKLIEAFAA